MGHFSLSSKKYLELIIQIRVYRAALFKHMFSEHNFNIGLPDNLVNVNEFLDMLESKLAK